MNTPHIRDFAGKRIHMIGIGGSSMSGLAEMLIEQGYRVTGSDRDEGYLIHHVREAGGEVMRMKDGASFRSARTRRADSALLSLMNAQNKQGGQQI